MFTPSSRDGWSNRAPRPPKCVIPRTKTYWKTWIFEANECCVTPFWLVCRHSFLIENLGETLEAVLTPVIQRAVIYRGRKMYIKLGDSEVEFHPDFRSASTRELVAWSSFRLRRVLSRPLHMFPRQLDSWTHRYCHWFPG